ncbi:MAG: SCP2 sterol-binding domain-containing protein [Lachnospiraceae bacterium]|nr:SCP2 sterol-binding domain-containing protein [Lachnospiraceae bacterium]MBP5185074.1 SCP2 sterol-binding domain-containing protein [Lachnospiraceae bacterium]
MKINVYYGGRGLIDDPTIFVIDKLTEVLEELRVNVTRYNLYEQKNSGLTTLPGTLKEADGIILAASVEWLGIGGFLHQFLDACWLYGDKERIGKLYMLPVVVAGTVGERESMEELIRAWSLLGGVSIDGICAYAESKAELESVQDYVRYIEKTAENLYRYVNQKQKVLPNSVNNVRAATLHYSSIAASPQESEQLSAYVSDDHYVQQQKADIEELTSLFSGMLSGDDNDRQEYLRRFRENYKPQGQDFVISYAIEIKDLEKTLVVDIKGNNMNCYYGEKPDADIVATTNRSTMDRIVHGRTTFQGAFMSGEISTRGNFKMLRTFDNVFQFNII